MRTIWKFHLADATARCRVVQDTPVLDLDAPVDASALDVQMQEGRAVLWAEVETDQPSAVHRFAVIGTGQPIPPFVDEWIGTWQEGPFVWHLYTVDVVQLKLAELEEGS